MTSHGGEGSSPIKAATNEWALLAFRVVSTLLGLAATGIGTLVMIGVTDLRSQATELGKEMGDIRRTVAANRLEDANRLGKVEGQVAEIKGSVDAHRRRLDSNDGDIRLIWNRIFELRPLPAAPLRP